MAVVTVTTTPVALGPDLGMLGATQAILLDPDGAIVVGDSTVTAANGQRLAAAEKISLPHYNTNRIFAVTASGTTTVRVALI